MRKRIKRFCRRYKRIKRIVYRRSGWNLVGWPVMVLRKTVSALVGFAVTVPVVFLMMLMMVAFG